MKLPIKYKLYQNKILVRWGKDKEWKIARWNVSSSKYIPITQSFGNDFQWTKSEPVEWKGRWFYKEIIGIDGHNGIDFLAPTGTRLYAPHDGEVTEIWNKDGRGIRLTGKDYESLFLHLQDWTVNLGDKVQEGDLIGYTDNTGRYTTAPHLHWGVKPINGTYIDHRGFIENLEVEKLPYPEGQCLMRTEANGEFYVVEDSDLAYKDSDKQPDSHIPIVDFFIEQKDKGLPAGFIKSITEEEFNKFNHLIK